MWVGKLGEQLGTSWVLLLSNSPRSLSKYFLIFLTGLQLMPYNLDSEFQFERKAYANNNSNLGIMTAYHELKHFTISPGP